MLYVCVGDIFVSFLYHGQHPPSRQFSGTFDALLVRHIVRYLRLDDLLLSILWWNVHNVLHAWVDL